MNLLYTFNFYSFKIHFNNIIDLPLKIQIQIHVVKYVQLKRGTEFISFQNASVYFLGNVSFSTEKILNVFRGGGVGDPCHPFVLDRETKAVDMAYDRGFYKRSNYTHCCSYCERDAVIRGREGFSLWGRSECSGSVGS